MGLPSRQVFYTGWGLLPANVRTWQEPQEKSLAYSR